MERMREGEDLKHLVHLLNSRGMCNGLHGSVYQFWLASPLLLISMGCC